MSAAALAMYARAAGFALRPYTFTSASAYEGNGHVQAVPL